MDYRTSNKLYTKTSHKINKYKFGLCIVVAVKKCSLGPTFAMYSPIKTHIKSTSPGSQHMVRKGYIQRASNITNVSIHPRDDNSE